MSRFQPNGFRNAIELTGEAREARLVGTLCDDIQSLIFIVEDLKASRKWFELALSATAADKDDPDTVSPATQDLRSGLYHAAITMYAKCFHHGHGRTIKLNEEWIPAGLLPLHQSCWVHRNNMTGHAGNGPYERLDHFVVLDPTSEQKVQITYVGHAASSNFDASFAEAMLDLIPQVIDIVQTSLAQHQEIVVNGFYLMRDDVWSELTGPDSKLNIELDIDDENHLKLRITHV